MNKKFEHNIMLDKLGKAMLETDFAATEDEREILAQRFSLLGIDSFEGRFSAQREEDGSVVVDGSFGADVVQACGLTMEPVRDHVEDSFHVRFVPDLVLEPIDEDDLESLVDMEDQEPLEGDSVPVGEIIAQYLALSLNPYPRAEGVAVSMVNVGDDAGRVRLMTEDEAMDETRAQAEAAPSPFDVLKKLKDGA